jgi:ubiquinone/menaquinone biosynthesis C-methylase UbiE
MSQKTSWQSVHRWYNSMSGEKGHYFQEHVVLPKLKQLLHSSQSVVDLACGNGVLANALPQDVTYLGIDIAKGLIQEAKKKNTSARHYFLIGDITTPLHETLMRDNVPELKSLVQFDAATCILALQNVKEGSRVVENASRLLKEKGLFIIVLNHPSFRIPRQSGWGIDEQNKLHYRKVIKYMSPLEIPIDMHPGKKTRSPVTWSYHYPLSTYTQWLKQAGFVITNLEEWTSDKESTGKAAKMENMSRSEIPLFLCIVAKKIEHPKNNS